MKILSRTANCMTGKSRRLIFLVLISAAFLLTGRTERGRTAERTEYSLLEEDELVLYGSQVKGTKEGLSVYVVAGIHGDETAGWKAAERLAEERLDAGALYIVSPANEYGAAYGKRKTREERDLNRNFPGDPNGCDAERIAAAIYEDIKEKQPALVLDLHEARPGTEEKDALGNSLICSSLEDSGELVLELLAESEKVAFTSCPFTLYGSPPPGSVNRTVTEMLGIPVVTVETFRGDALELRIQNHLRITDYVLKYYGLRKE